MARLTVYVVRGDLDKNDRQIPRNYNNQRSGPRFPHFGSNPAKGSDANSAREILSKLFEENGNTKAILLFANRADAERRARHHYGSWDDRFKRILQVNLVGNLYRELRAYIHDAQYTGQLPKIQGNAFLVIGDRLAEKPQDVPPPPPPAQKKPADHKNHQAKYAVKGGR
ncbi:hypothetical protein KJ359_010491 [Pestalotiopsis sp. 9143b]|nr:hypothetical protein KJ359_010491 [Pestalotiopsis sp. 9143b]